MCACGNATPTSLASTCVFDVIKISNVKLFVDFFFRTTRHHTKYENVHQSKISRYAVFISALPQYGYSRAATIRSTDVAAIYYLFQRYRNAATIRGRLLFEVRYLFEEIRYAIGN